MSAYDRFIRKVREIYDLRRIGELLSWDQETYMPENGIGTRSHARATLSTVIHDKLVSKKMKRSLEEVAAPSTYDDLDEFQRANVREVSRLYDRAVNVPPELVREISKTTSRGTDAWKKARERSDFNIFRPWLIKIIDLKKREAEYIGYE